MRLDVYLVEVLGVPTRSKAQNLIKLGRVTLDGVTASKAGLDVTDKHVAISVQMEYASMGGYKLAKALDEFKLNIADRVCADIGASNGGFTSVLLSRGCAKVYAVDVGDCALPDELISDRRVIVRDRLNARELSAAVLGEAVDIAVADVSFISLRLILDNIASIVKSGGSVVALIKPQFEVGKKFLSKKGIVIDSKAREKAVAAVINCAELCGLRHIATTTAPEFANKNLEYLTLFNRI